MVNTNSAIIAALKVLINE